MAAFGRRGTRGYRRSVYQYQQSFPHSPFEVTRKSGMGTESGIFWCLPPGIPRAWIKGAIGALEEFFTWLYALGFTHGAQLKKRIPWEYRRRACADFSDSP